MAPSSVTSFVSDQLGVQVAHIWLLRASTKQCPVLSTAPDGTQVLALSHCPSRRVGPPPPPSRLSGRCGEPRSDPAWMVPGTLLQLCFFKRKRGLLTRFHTRHWSVLNPLLCESRTSQPQTHSPSGRNRLRWGSEIESSRSLQEPWVPSSYCR